MAVSELSSETRRARPKSVIWGWPSRSMQDVRGLQVAVEEALAVGVMDGRRQLGHEPRRGPGIAGIPGALLGEVASVDELHAEEGDAVELVDLVDRHDVGVVEVGGELGFAAEPLPLRGACHRAREDHLERHRPPQRLLHGLVDDPHPAPGDLLEQEIIADLVLARRDGPAVAVGVRIGGRAVRVVRRSSAVS